VHTTDAQDLQGVVAHDPGVLDALLRLRAERGASFPRITLAILDWHEAGDLHAALARISARVATLFSEITVLHDSACDEVGVALLPSGGPPQLRLVQVPRRWGYGGLRKIVFEHALEHGFDYVVVLPADGEHAPEALPALLAPALLEGSEAVFGRPVGRSEGTGAAGAIRPLATRVQAAVLGLPLHDFECGYRLYATRVLRAIPFQQDADDRGFERHVAIQLRALGLAIHEVPVPSSSSARSGREEGIAGVLLSAARGCATALDYRLHQLHITRRTRYLVDHGIHYTLKRSPTGSHMQIVDAIRPGSRVLDLGCSQGLLAGPLREKGVRITGVDVGPGENLAPELEAYHPRDLEQRLELPADVGREFDYVVCSDVIEHVRGRRELLRSVRRYLKADGRLLISTPNIAIWFYRLSLLAGRFNYGPRGILDETHVHLFTRATFRRLVEEGGFHIVRERVTALPFEVVLRSTGRSRLVAGLARVYHALARLWPALFAYQFLLEAEITVLERDERSAGVSDG
jgi:2-polyprenyl-3-methyl-5-hydroxy-6-metoxy-1,4-benzoquinol methylase